MKKDVTVFQMAGYQSPYGGNFISSLMALEDKLNELGKKVVYVFPVEAQEREWCRVMLKMDKSILFFDSSKSMLSQILKLRKLIKKYNCKIIHSHFSQFDIVSAISCYFDSSVDLYWHVHSDFSGGIKRRFVLKKAHDLVRNKIIGKKVRYITVSNDIKNQLVANGISNDRCFYVANGLSKKRLITKTEGRVVTRQLFNLKENDIFILLFGWHSYIKGVDIAINSVINARKLNKNIVLGIVTGRNNSSEQLMKYINCTTGANGTEDWIRYLPPTEDVFSYHKASDIFLSSSRSEGFPYSILESLSEGKYVICSDIPGTEWAKEYSTVYTFKSGDINFCCQLLLNVIGKIGVENENEKQHEVINLIDKKYLICNWCKRIILLYNMFKLDK